MRTSSAELDESLSHRALSRPGDLFYCERLYEDTKKCPHHLIIIRKADILARRAAQGA